MNDKRKQHRDFLNNTFASEEQLQAEELLYSIRILLSTPLLSNDDKIILHKMMKNLEQNKSGQSKKILRSIEKKIQRIKEQYTR